MPDTVIEIENLSKQYRLGLVGARTINQDLERLWAKFRGKEDPFMKVGDVNRRDETGGSEYVWALKDINLSVKRGEVLGIIGKNGAGKSTLLKILSRVTGPTTGSIKAKGRIASLLEVGTGFHPELTGRENIYLNGAVLGMKKQEIKRKLDEIVEFSGIAKYVDTPVKRYSSGMTVRLGFAVAAHLEPEILVVDEVLAVGDVEFQKKCVGKMKEVSGEGRTVLFVSHNMASVKNLCTRGVLMENGQIALDTDADTAVSAYLDRNLSYGDDPVLKEAKINEIAEGIVNNNAPTVRMTKVWLENESNKITNRFYSNEPVLIHIEIKTMVLLHDLRVVTELVDEYGNAILTSQVSDDSEFLTLLENRKLTPGTYRFTCAIPKNLLSEKRYHLSFQVINVKHEHIRLDKALYFDVKFTGYNNVQYGSFSGSYLRPLFQWKYKQKTTTEIC